MNENTWLRCTNPGEMLIFLRGKAADRKLRLFACQCCRGLLHLLDDRARHLAQDLEREAAGLGAVDSRERAADLIERNPRSSRHVARQCLSHILGGAAWAAAWNVATDSRRALALVSLVAADEEAARQAWLAREIFGNLFRPVVVDASALTRRVTQLAQVIYDHADFDGLGILSDALEEAGCSDPVVL